MAYETIKDRSRIKKPTQTTESFRYAVPAVKHDSNDLSIYCDALYCGVAGNVVAIPCGPYANGDSNTVTFVVNAGQVLPVQLARILATGSSANALVLLYN